MKNEVNAALNKIKTHKFKPSDQIINIRQITKISYPGYILWKEEYGISFKLNTLKQKRKLN